MTAINNRTIKLADLDIESLLKEVESNPSLLLGDCRLLLPSNA